MKFESNTYSMFETEPSYNISQSQTQSFRAVTLKLTKM